MLNPPTSFIVWGLILGAARTAATTRGGLRKAARGWARRPMQRPLLAVASDSSGAAAPPDTAPSSPSKSTKPAMRDLIKGEADKRVRPLQAVAFFVVFFLVSCGFAASQEIIVTTPGFKPLHRSFLTLSHSVAYCLFASMELARAGWTPGQRTTPLRHYLAVAVFCFLSVFLANNSDARRVRAARRSFETQPQASRTSTTARASCSSAPSPSRRCS